jgi:hypothetical protein
MNFSNLADWQQKAAGTLEGVTLYKTVSIGAMSDFSDEQLQVICEAAEVIACECPRTWSICFAASASFAATPGRLPGISAGSRRDAPLVK